MKVKLIVLIAVVAAVLSSCNQAKETRTNALCDRACLENFINMYIDAVIAHDPLKVKLRTDVKFTENGQKLEPGDGLWNTASGLGTYKIYIADPESGQAGFIGTIRENGVPANDGRPVDIDGMGCKEQFETGFFNFVTRIRDRRFVVVDEARGLVLSFAFFDHTGNIPEVTLTNGMTIPIGVKRPWTWEIAELFKIENGLIRQIEALYQEAPYGMGSGWSSWEKAISDKPIYK